MPKLPRVLIKILMPVMSILTPTCEVVSQKLSYSMDKPLPLSDRIKIRLHLMVCELCTRYEKQLKAMRKMLDLHADEINQANENIKLSPEARARIKQTIDRSK